jgi:teichuronic acid biosynthesis glycosyltransferase TuaC
MKGARTVIVFSSLFPSPASPHSGAFIRERMFRVGKKLPIIVVSPQPWFPLDWLIRKFRKSYRPIAPHFELMEDIAVYRPRFLCFPSYFKNFDGFLMAVGAQSVVMKLCAEKNICLIDAHFLFPDGFAASKLAKKHHLPLTVTIRGSKDEWLIGTPREKFLKRTLMFASKVISVSAALQLNVAKKLETPPGKCVVIGNGVDLGKFGLVDKSVARATLGIASDAKVLISVGGLVERKGFHRIIPLLPQIRREFPNLIFLIVGGGTTQADMTEHLRSLAAEHGVGDIVRFCGSQPPEKLKWFYGAADVFTLATSHEGWANVFLESMACGLPIVTTAVGGNAEVITSSDLGVLVPYFDEAKFGSELAAALRRDWNREKLIAYAQSNTWDDRVRAVLSAFSDVIGSEPSTQVQSISTNRNTMNL